MNCSDSSYNYVHYLYNHYVYYQDWIDDDNLPTPDIINFPSNRIVFPPLNHSSKDDTAKLQNDNNDNIMQYWSFFDDNDMWETFNNLQMESNGKIIFQANSHMNHLGNVNLNREQNNSNNLTQSNINNDNNLHSQSHNTTTNNLNNITTIDDTDLDPDNNFNGNRDANGNNTINRNNGINFGNMGNPTVIGSVFDLRTMPQIENKIQNWQFSMEE